MHVSLTAVPLPNVILIKPLLLVQQFNQQPYLQLIAYKPTNHHVLKSQKHTNDANGSHSLILLQPDYTHRINAITYQMLQEIVHPTQA